LDGKEGGYAESALYQSRRGGTLEGILKGAAKSEFLFPSLPNQIQGRNKKHG
jgi:hypothetical protein